MSHHSGFSSASRMEIERLNQEAVKSAAENAAKDERIAAMEAMLAANGLLHQQSGPTQAQLPKQTKAHAQGQARTQIQARQNSTLVTPSRKRHSSQQLGGNTKGSRFSNNPFDLLNEPDSFMDQSCNDPNPNSATRAGFEPRTSTQLPIDTHTRSTTEQGVLPIFTVENVDHMRQEIEVGFEKVNGEPFRGSITRQEAKHLIYKQCLGFEDFSNFDGVRPGYKGVPIMIFKLKSAINVDVLLSRQHFEFRRTNSRNGRSHVDIISCKICGLRKPGSMPAKVNSTGAGMNARPQDDGTQIVKLEGCDYRIPKLVLLNLLAFFGVIKSEITEDLFNDGNNPDSEEEGTNRTGIYSVTIQIKKPIPQLLPILGRRVKVHYPGVQRLCTKCFGKHPKQACHTPKVSWPDYVRLFISRNPDITKQLFGKWYGSPDENVKEPVTPSRVDQLIQNRNVALQNNPSPEAAHLVIDAASKPQAKTNQIEPAPSSSRQAMSEQDAPVDNAPRAATYLVPADETEYNLMVEKMVNAGLLRSEAELNIAARKAAFNKACKEYKRSESKQPKTTKRITKMRKHVNKSLDEYGN